MVLTFAPTMQVSSAQLENDFSLQIYSSILTIDEKVWNNINTEVVFYKTQEFLSVIENTQNNIEFRYVLIKKMDVVVAALYMQLLDFSFKNLVNYSANNSAGFKSNIKKYIAKKNAKLLNLGNVFFTGDNGIICKNDDVEIIELIPQIFKIISKTFKDKKPTASLIANIYLQDEKKCSHFGSNAFHAFTTEPDMFMNINKSWNTFDDYLNALSSKYRVRNKKVLSTSNQIIQKIFSFEDVIFYKKSMQDLYNNVMNHVAFNMATLNIDFFEKMKILYGEKCTIFGYFLDDKLVSFACLFQVDLEILHVHYIGLNYDINKEYKLYNRMLLDFIKFAIEHRKLYIHFGRTATEIKTTIGATPNPLQAYLKMNNSVINLALPYFLNRIKPADFIARNPFK